MIDVTFVGTGTISRLPEVLSGPGTHIRLIGNPDNPLRRSRYVDDVITLEHTSPADLADALLAHPALIAGLNGWVVFGEDTTPRNLATSDLPLADKRRLLPARTLEGLAMLGSKAGLARLQSAVGRGGPRSVVAADQMELDRAIEQADRPVLIKSDGGAGGEQIRLIRPGHESGLPDIPADWFPVVVQDYVPGVDVSVEVLMRDGTLAGWMYSTTLRSSGPYGPSTARRYLDPPLLDFVEDLEELAAAAGLHGFFNCSLRWSPQDGRHYLFELDPRPNAWHQFGRLLGVDWRVAMSGSGPGHCLRPHLPGPGRILRLYPRELTWGITEGDWASIEPWLLARPGTWATRNRLDTRINRADRDALIEAAEHQARMRAARALGLGWRLIPEAVRSSPRLEGLRHRTGALLGTESPRSGASAGGEETPDLEGHSGGR